MTEKEVKEKEITRSNERWCRITKKNCEVVVSSPYEDDKMESITKEADRLATKHSEDKRNETSYIG